MTPRNRNLWLPLVAVSECIGDDAEYGPPAITTNDVGALARFSADAIQFGFSVFEGMRAYVADPSFLVFRARDHHERLMASCAALELPCPAYEVFVEAIEQVVRANWDGGATRLYLRPVVFSAGGDVMPQQDSRYIFVVLVKRFDPVLEGMSVLVEETMPRTVPMFAAVKTAGNYTSSALAMRKARRAGCDTILWLDGNGHIQECTTMNVFLFLDGEIVTPKLGSILPGVTRKTVIELLTGSGERVVERDIRLSEVMDALARRKSPVMFTTSTALGIQRVSRLRVGTEDHGLGDEMPSTLVRVGERYSELTERFSTAGDEYAAMMARSHFGYLSGPNRGHEARNTLPKGIEPEGTTT
ncbi:aminotransferase class IV [Halostreptopolyspora alba]